MRVALVSLQSFYDHSLALDYLVSYASLRPRLAEAVEFQVFVESDGRSINDFLARVIDFRPDVVGFNTYVWNIETSINVAEAIKTNLPGTVIVFGGMEATFNPAQLLSDVPGLNFIVIGEGEITFADLLEALVRGDPFAVSQPGLAWRNDSKVSVIGGLGKVLTKIDEVPSPFQNQEFASRGVRRVLYESYRGCAFQCSFCLYQRDYAAQRYFSEGRVKADLDAILQSGATHIRFVDATFNLNRRRAKNLLRHLQDCKADVCVEVSAEFFDSEMVHLLPSAGIRHVDIGLQSTQSAPLSAVHREWYRQDRFRENLKLLRSEPTLTLNVELIAGLPGDSLEGLRRSLDEAVLRWPDHVSVYRLLGLKGTSLERESQKLGLKFAPKPPYELLESSDFPLDALRQVDELTFAHLILFNLGVGRYALRYLVEVLNLRPSEVYDEFLKVIFNGEIYSSQEARFLGRHHAYGNRFDQPMPPSLGLTRVHEATKYFFERAASDRLGSAERGLVTDLVDFGHSLAMLDGINAEVVSDIHSTSPGAQVAPWCRQRRYSSSIVAELVRQGHELGELTPNEVATVVFFVHPEFGPAALAADEQTAEVLDRIERGLGNVDRSATDMLRDLAILV